MPLTAHVDHRAPFLRPLLLVGFLGGWTTYSTLAVETTLLAKDGDVGTCVAYLAATVDRWADPGRARSCPRPSDGPGVSGSSPTLELALLVALAGGAGAVLRALLIHHVGAARGSTHCPLAHCWSMRPGLSCLGVLTGLALYHGLGSHLLAVIGVGLCGGYTTWSTASWETIHLLHTGHRAAAVVYTVGGLAVCLAAAAAGIGLTAIA